MIAQKPVTRIGDYAFYACTKLSDITIPASVTSIGTGAFSGCTVLKRIVIPAGVTYMGSNIFSACPNLGYISVGQGNTTNYVSIDGVLLDTARTTLIAYPGGKSGNYTIPSTVKTIGSGAFHSCAKLSSVFIPASVTNIGSEAFKYCEMLTRLTIPSNVKVIGDGAFSNCVKLETVTLPSGLNRIPNSAFNSCIKLNGITIPSMVTSIGNDAFSSCIALKVVTIPSKVTSIGSLAFFNCSGLTQAIFTGAAPSMGKENPAFGGTAEGFTIYYYESGAGFSSPTWYGYPSFNIGDETPQKAWLIKWELPHDTSMLSDSNNDGVSLLMAYALNLNPTQNLSDLMPQAELSSGSLVMSFYAGASGISYMVESSTDMVHWSTQDVVISDLDWNLIRTATVNEPGTSRFMRLVVSQ